MAASKKIILIDDHEIVRHGLSLVLDAESDFTVISQCANADVGLSQILELKPDIAVVDINMPGNSIFEIINTALKQLPELKVLFLTAYDTESNVERALASGASGFLTKNESLTTIVSAIRNIIAGNAPYISQKIMPRIVSHGKNGEETHEISSNMANFTSRKNLLSPRELEVLCCVAQGQSAKQIAQSLNISAKTVERHKSNIMTKLNIHTQVDLTRYAIREGIISA